MDGARTRITYVAWTQVDSFEKESAVDANNNPGCFLPSGTGFIGLLTLVFITLKLCGVLDWSWVWVLSPIWISLVLSLLIFFTVLSVITVAFVVALFLDKDK